MNANNQLAHALIVHCVYYYHVDYMYMGLLWYIIGEREQANLVVRMARFYIIYILYMYNIYISGTTGNALTNQN